MVLVSLRRKWLTLVALLAFAGLFGWLMVSTPKAFVPSEDMGGIFSDIALPLGASQERTKRYYHRLRKWYLKCLK
jgi:HAE1 family hydrophobic/amphiphilic exporter-1